MSKRGVNAPVNIKKKKGAKAKTQEKKILCCQANEIKNAKSGSKRRWKTSNFCEEDSQKGAKFKINKVFVINIQM